MCVPLHVRRWSLAPGFILLILSATARAGLAAPEQTTVVNGNWETFIHPYRSHTATYDPLRNRLLVFGGTPATSGVTNDVWELTLSGTPTWNKLTTTGTPPAVRFDHSAIYDPVRDRMIMYGGNIPGDVVTNQIWALTLSGTPAWSQIIPTGSVPVRYKHTAIYDPLRDRMLVFGGSEGGNGRNRLYELTLAGTPAWNEITILPSPSPRMDHAAIYDPVRDRMVIYGGNAVADGSPYSDISGIWALDLAGSPAWTQLPSVGPAPPTRYAHSAFYDPAGDRMVIFGGRNGMNYLNDAWALSLASPAWTQLTPTGTPPSPRYEHTGSYDSAAGRMIVVDGVGGPGSSNAVGAYQLSLGGTPGWSTLGPVSTFPVEHSWHSAIWDAAQDRMLVFGGLVGPSSFPATNETWQLTLGASPVWSQVSTSGSPPSARSGQSAIMDPVRNRMIVFGGTTSGGGSNDVWSLSLSGTPTWTQLAPLGSPPSPRTGHRAFYDPSRDRMVVYGGYNFGYLGDVWALSLSGTPAWSPIATSGTPPAARLNPALIYDPVRDRMIVCGGGVSGGYAIDLWQLSFTGTPTWSPITPAGSTPTVRSTPAIYDPVRDRMVFFGGQTNSPPGSLNDNWSLDLATMTWQGLVPTGGVPSGRNEQAVVYDRVHDRMVMFGGQGNGALGDSWFLQWPGAPVGPDADVVPMTLNFGAVSVGATPTKTVVVTNYGTASLSVSNVASPDATVSASPTSFSLSPFESRNVTVQWTPAASGPLATTVTVTSDDANQPAQVINVSGSAALATGVPDPVVADRFGLRLTGSNPATGGARLELAVPTRSEVVVRVFDLRGALVRELARREFAPGFHPLVWDGADADGHHASSGMYFVQASGPEGQLNQRVVLTR